MPMPSFAVPAVTISLPSAHSRPCSMPATLPTVSFDAPLNSAMRARKGWILSLGTFTRTMPSSSGGGATLASGSLDRLDSADGAASGGEESPMREAITRRDRLARKLRVRARRTRDREKRRLAAKKPSRCLPVSLPGRSRRNSFPSFPRELADHAPPDASRRTLCPLRTGCARRGRRLRARRRAHGGAAQAPPDVGALGSGTLLRHGDEHRAGRPDGWRGVAQLPPQRMVRCRARGALQPRFAVGTGA